MSKRKAPEVSEPVQFLHLDFRAYCEVTREGDPGDEWDRDDTSTTWVMSGIALSDHDGYQGLPADFPVQIGDTVFVVYAVYSTGDSFGNDDGAELEVLSFHKNETIARLNVEALQTRVPKDSGNNMRINFDSGVTVDRYCPWDGYFESLDYVRCESFVVTALD